MRNFLLLCFVLLTSVIAYGQTIFTQNFEATWTLPPTLSPAWSGTTTPANNVWHKNSYTTGWTQGTTAAYTPTGANGTTASARFHTYYANAGTTGDLITPVMNLSAYTAGKVVVKFYYINTDGSDFLDVYSSNDGGTTWSASLMTLTTTTAWQEFFVFLPGNSATTKIKFTATSDYGYTDIGIDEVRVLNPVIPLPPLLFSVSAVTSGGMTISWMDGSINEVGFRVYRSTDGVNFTQNGPDIISTTVGTWGTLYSQVQSGLWANQTYYFRIVAYADLESTILPGSQATLAATPICGTKTVGTSGADYPNLYTAVNDLKGHYVTCPVTFLLNSDYISASETWPIVIPVIPGVSAANPVTIKPNTGVSAAVTGSSNGPLIKILSSNVIIDGSNSPGGTTRDLTFTNTSATSPNVFWIGSTLTTPITNITVKNSIQINGANTSSAIVLSDGTTIGNLGYFNNISFQNNSIQKAYNGIYCVAVLATGNGTGILISGNDLNTAGANSIRDLGIYLWGVTDATITNNNIGNMANANAENVAAIFISQGIKTATISGNNISNLSLTSNNAGVVLLGIYVNPISAPTSINISGNTIQTLANTGNFGGFAAIATYCPNTNITNNTISGLTQNGNTAATNAFWGILQANAVNSSISGNTVSGLTTSRASSIATGIEVQSVSTGITIEKNTIFNIKSTNANSTAIGLALNATTPASNFNVRNNLIYDVASAGFNSYTTRNGYGILIGSGGGYNLFHNTVRLSTNQTLATGLPACLMISAAGVTLLDVRNNIFSIDATVGTNRYAILSNSDISAFTKIDYNDYYSSGANLGYIGSNRATLADMLAGFGGNNNAQNINPTFVGTDLHPTNSALSNKGFYLASVPTDFSGANRPDPPDVGGYQFSVNQTVATAAATNATCTSVTLNGSVNASNLIILSGFEYGLTTAYGTSVSAGTITGNTATPITADVTGLVINNTYHYRAKGTSGSTLINGSDMTFSTGVPPLVATVTAAPVLPTSAVLNGTVNPKNGNTVVSFEYGLTPAYGLVAFIPGTLTGNTIQNFNATISGLMINTTYYYRAKAVSPAGTVYGSDMSFFTNCIIPPAAGTITGPPGVCKNGTGYTYSLSAVPNGFYYNWTFPAGFTITSYQHSNVITVDVSNTAVSGVVSVQAVSDCGAPGTPSTKTVTVNNLPVPLISSGASLACQNSNYNYATQAGKSSYVWSVSPNGTITPTSNPEVVTLYWNSPGSKTVGVIYTDPATGCTAASPGTMAVTVPDPPVPAIYGVNSMCVNSGFYQYTTESGKTSYTWTVSSGGTITAGQGTATAQVVWNIPGAQWVAVNYNNATNCSALTPTVYNVNVNAMPGAAGSISGSPSVCYGSSGITYSVPPVANAITYIWALPAGATITSGAGTNSILVNFPPTAQSGDITVYGNSLCGNGITSPPFNVAITHAPLAAGPVSGMDSVCAGEQGVFYSVDPVTNAMGYNWSLPAGATIVSGFNTPEILVDFDLNAVSGDISVFGTNQCFNGAESPAFSLTIKGLPHTPVIYAHGDTLFSEVPNGNQWYYEGSPVLHATGQTLVAFYTGWYWDKVIMNGCESDTSNNIHIVTTGISDPASSGFTVYPVPSKGAFTLKVNIPKSDMFDISVTNDLGVVVYSRTGIMVMATAEFLIDLGQVAPGVYTMVIRSANQKAVRKILISQ
ncbi:MAG: T9SS type A sorting domain-containing protein [Bacteroidota bacterium]